MFESFKSLWKKDQASSQNYDEQSRLLAEEISRLENELQGNSSDGETQKSLMLTYNRALSVYAKSTSYRHKIDSLFIRIDELRNIIRRNI